MLFFLRENAKEGALDLDVLDVIGKGFLFRGVNAQDVLTQLRAAPNTKLIRMRVNSVGGIVMEALSIFAVLRERAAAGTRIQVNVIGLAASAATILTDAGDDVTIQPGAYFMIHSAAGGTPGRGTAEDHQRAAETISKVDQDIVDRYVAASKRRGKNKTADEFRAEMKRERYFNASEAVAWGLADRVADPVAGAERIAACADITTLAEAPPELRAQFEALEQLEPPEAPPTPEARTDKTTPPPVAAATPAHAGRKNAMQITAEILALLGLTENATQAEFEAAIKAASEAPQPLSKLTLNAIGARNEAEAQNKAKELTTLGTSLLALTGASTIAGGLAKVSEWKVGAENAIKLAAKVSELETGIMETKRDARIEALTTSGKLPPSLHAWARTQTAEQLEVFAAGMPAFTGRGPTSPTEEVVALDADEKKICAHLGITEEAYLEQKKLDRKVA